jgi:hypothetical protein
MLDCIGEVAVSRVIAVSHQMSSLDPLVWSAAVVGSILVISVVTTAWWIISDAKRTRRLVLVLREVRKSWRRTVG